MDVRIGKGRGHGRGRPVANVEVIEEMRELRARIASMELGRKRDPVAGYVSDPEGDDQDEEETPMAETPEMRYFRSILGATSRPKPKLPTYEGTLTAEHPIDWINELDKYFEYDEFEEYAKVKLAATSLKGHASLWWDSVQIERRRMNNPLIKSWDRMVAKLRAKFLPTEYHPTLYRQMKT